MKRLLVLVLLVPILALTMISCDADMRSNLAGFMGGFRGNQFTKIGLVPVNYDEANKAAAAIAVIGDDAADISGGESTSAMGLAVTVPSDTKLLIPQNSAQQKILKDSLAGALNDSAQKTKMLDDLGQSATGPQKEAAQGTVTVFNLTLDKIKDELPSGSDLGLALEKLKLPVIGPTDDITQADLLTLQLMTDLISNTISILIDISPNSDLSELTDTELTRNKEELLKIVGEALFVADVAEKISGSDEMNIFANIDFGSLIDGFESRGSRSNSISLSEAGEFIDVINPIAPSIVSLLGVTRNGNTFGYTPKAYKSFLLNQSVYRSAMEQALTLLELGDITGDLAKTPDFGTSTIVKYALSVLVTEHHAYWEDWDGTNGTSSTPTANTLIARYLTANNALATGDLSTNDSINEVTDLDGFSYDGWPTFMTTSEDRIPTAPATTDKGRAFYKAILKNIITINKFGGLDILAEELTAFHDGTGDYDGFDSVYDDLISEIKDK